MAAQRTLNWDRLSRYERAKIIGWRAEMLARGAPALLGDLPPDIDPVDIARREMAANVLPFVVRRRMPDGSTEDVSLPVPPKRTRDAAAASPRKKK
jgi:DNA-directed RNA polymerase subunit K/omega